MAWSLAISMCLLAATAALIRRRGKSKPRRESSPSKPKTSAEAHGAALGKPGPAHQPPKTCPVCLSEYAEPSRFCVRDGAALVGARGHGPFAQGMICPACRRGYPADASFCPEDAEELVPYGLYGAASATRPPLRIDANKICPECGIPHAPSHVFCRQDGTELVVVN